MHSNPGNADKIHQYSQRRWAMTKTLKRSIGITFILILISALSGGGITLGMAVFSGNYISGIFFLLYILLSLIVLIYSSSNVIFALPCKKFLRTLFFRIVADFIFSSILLSIICMDISWIQIFWYMLKYKLFNESLSQFGCNLDDTLEVILSFSE